MKLGDLDPLLDALADRVAERIAAHLNDHAPAPIPRERGHLLRAHEVAQLLGCSTRYVYANANDFPFTRRVGGLVRFDAAGLQRWIERAP